jgi:hypothetical protein
MRDLPGGFALSELPLFFDGLLACGGELEELIHDEGCGYASGCADDDASEDGWLFGSHSYLTSDQERFRIRKV